MGALRTGESGRGKDVLGAVLFPCGLGALAPGPTEALNLGRPGVGGVQFDDWDALRPEVLGVMG